MELYILQDRKTNKGIYTSIDEAEIRVVVNGEGYTYDTIESSINISQERLACFEDNGEFYIQNEAGVKICDLTVIVETFQEDNVSIDSTSSIDIELSENYYNAYINGKCVDDINLTPDLKRDINNTIENWIFRTNEKNN